MNILTLAVVMQGAVVSFELQPYQDVYSKVADTEKPFIVIIGADWCPGCQVLKRKTVPQVANEGGFKGIGVAYVDYDRDAKLAKQLMKGTTIPQVIRFQRNGNKWEMERLSGVPNRQALTSFAQGRKQLTPVLLTSTK